MSETIYGPYRDLNWETNDWQQDLAVLVKNNHEGHAFQDILLNKAFYALHFQAPEHLKACFEAGLSPHFLIKNLSESADERWCLAFLFLMGQAQNEARYEMIELFLQAGLQWECLGEAYICPLGDAILSDHLPLIKLFLAYGAPLKGLPGVWQPPVYYVQSPEVMALLLDHDLPIQSFYGVSGWLWTIALLDPKKAPDVFELLVKRNISLDLPDPMQDHQDQTALEALMTEEDWSGMDIQFVVCAALIYHGANYSRLKPSLLEQSKSLIEAKAYREKQALESLTQAIENSENSGSKRL